MSRNNKFINNMLELSNRSRKRNLALYCVEAMPYLYSAVALVLYREYGWRVKRLSNLFKQVDDIWNEYADKGTTESLAEICYKETGIALIPYDEAVEKGIINGDL